MRFTTLIFLLFFIVVYLLFWNLRGRSRMGLLVVASLIFYGAWSIGFALHFFAIVAINYLLFAKIQRSRSRAALWGAVMLNGINLIAFKYFYFFLEALGDLTGLTIFDSEIFNGWLFSTTGWGSIVLPLAISFYTFQLIAFQVDAWRGGISERIDFLRFSLFILFFPQLVAGPIMRHSDFFHQLDSIEPDQQKSINGMFLIASGLVKKVVIADNIGPLVRGVFYSPEQYDAASNLLVTIAFVVQVYCDFSGYTDIARGLAALFGLSLPENFRAPFFSRSNREIWQRWHITLSTWLRDYIYFPLGGSRGSRLRSNFNLFATFALGGFWHGASYNFVIWGALHGLYLVGERSLAESFATPIARVDAAWQSFTGQIAAGPRRRQMVNWRWWLRGIGELSLANLQRLIVFTLFVAASIFFGTPDFARAMALFGQILSAADGMRVNGYDMLGGLIVAGFLFQLVQYHQHRFRQIPAHFAYPLLFLVGLVTIWLLGRFAPGGQDFIYFQF